MAAKLQKNSATQAIARVADRTLIVLTTLCRFDCANMKILTFAAK